MEPCPKANQGTTRGVGEVNTTPVGVIFRKRGVDTQLGAPYSQNTRAIGVMGKPNGAGTEVSIGDNDGKRDSEELKLEEVDGEPDTDVDRDALPDMDVDRDALPDVDALFEPVVLLVALLVAEVVTVRVTELD